MTKKRMRPSESEKGKKTKKRSYWGKNGCVTNNTSGLVHIFDTFRQ